MESRSEYLLISYPKTGRTWLRYLIGNVLFQELGIEEPFLSDTNYILKPWKIRDKYETIPSIYYSHDDRPHRKKRLQIESNKKRFYNKSVIFLYRDPRAVAVSQYYSLKERTLINPYKGSLSEFIRDEEYGPANYIHYLNIWMKEKSKFKNILFLSYEELSLDTKKSLSAVMNILGFNVGNDTLNIAINKSDFKQMQKLEEKEKNNHVIARKNEKKPNSAKMRKGKIDGYREELSEEDLTFLNELISERLDKRYGFQL